MSKEPQVKVIRDLNDRTKDYYLTATRAQELYNAHKLLWDRDKETYRCQSPAEGDNPT